MNPPISRVKWEKTYRLINSCYPPCNIWEDIISNNEDWISAIEISEMTNSRVRQEIGDISLISKERMITGINSWWVISAFTHVNPNGSRFNDANFGAYYATNDFITAVKEKAYGYTKEFMEATKEPIIDITCRTLLGKIDNNLHDIRQIDSWKECYLENDYTYSQELAKKLREEGSYGIVYKSIRDKDGECFAAFWPDVIDIPIQERHVVFHWNGEKVESYFEIREGFKERIKF